MMLKAFNKNKTVNNKENTKKQLFEDEGGIVKYARKSISSILNFK